MLLALPLLFGCAPVPLDVNHFSPEEIKLETADITGKAALYEYNSVLVVDLTLANRSSMDILPKEYSVVLADGRDLKPVKMLKRSDLVEVRSKYTAGNTGGAIQDQLIAATMNNVMNAVNVPTKDKLINIIDKGIAQYFEFRPIYAGAERSGVLCFLPDFKLEYPLTLTVKCRDKKIEAQFQPASK